MTTASNVGLAIDGIAAADPDANGGIVKLTLRVSRGTIKFLDLGTVTISEGANDSSRIAVAGTLAEVNALLAAGNLRYEPPADFAGTAALRLTLNDLGGTGSGGPKEARATVRVRVL